MDLHIHSKIIKTSMWWHANSRIYFFVFLIYIKCSSIFTHQGFEEITSKSFRRAIFPSLEILQEICYINLGTLEGNFSFEVIRVTIKMLIIWIYTDLWKARNLNLRSSHSPLPNIPLEPVSQSLVPPTLSVQAQHQYNVLIRGPSTLAQFLGDIAKTYPNPQSPSFWKFNSSWS